MSPGIWVLWAVRVNHIHFSPVSVLHVHPVQLGGERPSLVDILLHISLFFFYSIIY